MDNSRALFRGARTYTIVAVSSNGNIEMTQYESPSDTFLVIKRAHRSEACRVMFDDEVRPSAETDIFDNGRFLELMVARFASNLEDPYPKIRALLKNGGVEFNESVWSNN